MAPDTQESYPVWLRTNKLSDRTIKAAIKAAVQTGKARKLSDGDGLVLDARPTGAGWWRMRFWVDGKEGMVSLGTYPEVALATARERRDEARQQGHACWRHSGRCQEGQEGCDKGQGRSGGSGRRGFTWPWHASVTLRWPGTST